MYYFWPKKTITWHEGNGFRAVELSIPWSGRPGFKELSAPETGITFSNHLTREHIADNQHLLNGSGVAVGDVNGDGLADIYFCRLDGPNVLYKNLGDWKFEDVTAAAGVGCAEQFSTGTAFADIDGDNDLDLLVTTLGGPNFCFANDGQGNFTDVTNTSGLLANSGATTMALADIDADGDLDLYIANYKKNTVRDHYLPQDLEFDRIVKKVGSGYEIVPEFQDHYTVELFNNKILMRYEYAEPDKLYLNDKGHFKAVSFTDGRFLNEDGKPVSEPHDWGLTVRFQDIDEDGDPDIYVCNDFESPDRIWINDGAGHFQAIPKLSIRNTSWATMGVDFSDIDRDGDLDFLLLDMLSRDPQRRKTQMLNSAPATHTIGDIKSRPQNSRNSLFLNRGDKTFAEIAQFSGLHASEWSWSPLFLDVDLDGYEDILIATGHFYDALDADTLTRIRSTRYHNLTTWRNKIFEFPNLQTPNIAFRNRGDLTFEEVGEQWGFASTDVSHGMALGDFDNDGDLDVIINRLNAPAGVYRNESVAPRLAVRLQGLSPNTRGIGAKIRVWGGPVPQSKEVISAGAYLSSSDPLAVFAAHNAKHLNIEVTWRNGNVSTITDAKPNRLYEIYESAAQTDAIPPRDNIVTKTYFEDVSDLIDHVHHEEPYDDFRYQPLLPKKLSQLGPAVTWFDFDDDGDDDLLIGSGKGGHLTCFQNDGAGGFQRFEDRLFNQSAEFDQTAVLGWSCKNGTNGLLLAYSNWENRSDQDSFVLQVNLINGRAKRSAQIKGDISSIGPMTMADYDNDGDLDLFVGGRAKPARYPEPASSRLYRNQDGEFKLDTFNSAHLKDLGLVSGAFFSDFDADGDPDLILAVEWGPVMVFRNTGGRFSDATEALGLAGYHGWWQGVTTGDLNEDGKLDIVATNWGLNSTYQNRYDDEHPLRMFYSDFDNNGTLDVVETYFAPEMQKRIPGRSLHWMQRAMPNIRQRIPNHEKYSVASVQEVIGLKLSAAADVYASTLAHTVFFNRGDGFEAVEMPNEAQFSPAFYVGVADFDGDGHEDVFMSQNFFVSQPENSRSDAGRGLWLKGDGSGALTPVSGQVSGIKVYGEQRGAGLCDYDSDGRVDLVVSQNGASTKLYHNVGAKPGLRIRLTGPDGNRSAVGATIRLVYEDGYGPAREVHLGSGYWSQDSMVQVMGLRERVKGVWVRWPGGKTTNVPLTEGATEVSIEF
ncbi:MAG: FG-GAP-like repeat-containing protein [bacterium]